MMEMDLSGRRMRRLLKRRFKDVVKEDMQVLDVAGAVPTERVVEACSNVAIPTVGATERSINRVLYV